LRVDHRLDAFLPFAQVHQLREREDLGPAAARFAQLRENTGLGQLLQELGDDRRRRTPYPA